MALQLCNTYRCAIRINLWISESWLSTNMGGGSRDENKIRWGRGAGKAPGQWKLWGGKGGMANAGHSAAPTTGAAFDPAPPPRAPNDLLGGLECEAGGRAMS